MDPKRLAFVRSLNAQSVTNEDLRRVFEKSTSSRESQEEPSFGSISITRVNFELTPETKPPTVEAAAFFRLLALFAAAGRRSQTDSWFPLLPEDWATSAVVSAAASLPLLDFGDTFGFDEDEISARLGWEHPKPGAV